MNFEKLDRARIAAALLAAIITGGAALYGVYLKSREATAAGYETLAPEINRIEGELESIREENRQLREALARATGTKVADPAPPTGPEGRTVARRRRAAGDRAAPPPPGTPPGSDAGSPAAASEPPGPSAEQPAPPGAPDVIGDLKKRVPIDFEKAIRIWKDVQTIRKNSPPQN
jgi:hypothetical protein